MSEEIKNEVEEQEVAATETATEAPAAEATAPAEEAPKVTAPAVPDPNFDWDLDETVYSSYGDQDADLSKMYAESLNAIKEKEVVDGTVVTISPREVLVNIGSKSEGIISRNEFKYNPELKEGDTVDVFVEEQEDERGQLLLSHKKARAISSWNKVNEALDTGEIINGYIKCRTKGGMIVDVFGIEAFLPGSQIDVKPIRDYDQYVDKVMEFKVVKINQEFKNVVISHKALIEDELEEQRKEIISKLEKGQVLEGVVKNTTSYGVFIDLGGIDGLIHITDLSWGRISHPNEVVKLDEKINVVILDFDNEKKRIALGLKQLKPHPWESLDENMKEGDEVEGKVLIVADYGAFVEIAPGVEGLIHVSEMSWSQNLRTAQDYFKVGDIVKSKILSLDREERKMSLGIKQLSEDPWKNIETEYPLDSIHPAKVCNFTGFGIFVELKEGVDGLVHISDLSWTKKIKHPSEFTSIGAEINVMVLEIDKDNRRLSLSHKHTEENPWDTFETVFTIGSEHEGTITSIEKNNVKVLMPYGVEAFCQLRSIEKEDGSTAKVEDTLNFKVVDFSKNTRKVVVSHTAIFREEEMKTRARNAKNTKSNIAKNNQNLEKATLGDLGGLDKLKFEK